MSHITYNEFKNRFGDLGITYYVKYNWLSNHGLPNGYKALSYIKSVSGQYLNSGLNFLGTDDFKINVSFNVTEESFNEQPIVSIWSFSYNYWSYFLRQNTSLVYDIYADAHYTVNVQEGFIDRTASIERIGNNYTMITDGQKVTFTNSRNNNVNDLLILRRGDAAQTSKTIFYGMSVYRKNKLVSFIIPALRTSDNKPGAYDLVRNVFLTNQATGEFQYKEEDSPEPQVINPAIKIEGELGRYLNAQGEWTTGALELGAFKYEVTGGHTYDVVNAKAASSSYIMFLDANGTRIGNVVALTSSNYPKVGDTRPMAMPSNCKYVWLVMSSSNVNLPIPLIS